MFIQLASEISRINLIAYILLNRSILHAEVFIVQRIFTFFQSETGHEPINKLNHTKTGMAVLSNHLTIGHLDR